jgi:branched-subunit amino acid aminotransferase/4-amino-4-deoxychorismate lyase
VVKAQVEFAHRVNAKAKDSEWVRQRLELEQRKRGADINDVIMMTDDGALLEGTSSNFYAIKKGVVYTANEGILIGTVRTRVLSVCEQMGIPVVLQPPRAAEIAQWEAAFISSTSRIVLPLSHLWLPAAVVAAGDKERLCEFATGPDTLVSRLAKRVFDSILADSEPVLAGAWV